jgi:ribosome silencing factor RsfS/YbeB/iojap
LATSQTRDRSRKAGTPKAAKAAASRKAAPAAKVAAPAGKAASRKQAAPARKAAPRTKAAIAKAAGQPSRSRSKRTTTPDMATRLRALVLGALGDLKAKDVQEIDVRGKSSVTDLLVVASGTSSRHVKSIAEEVVKKAKHAGLPPIGVEGQREAEWVLVDLGDIVVHVMLPRTREFYGLERLWTVGDDMPAMLAG